MSNIKLASFNKEVTVLRVVIENKNLFPALVGLAIGVLVYNALAKQ